jgi:hypothetical protein
MAQLDGSLLPPGVLLDDHNGLWFLICQGSFAWRSPLPAQTHVTNLGQIRRCRNRQLVSKLHPEGARSQRKLVQLLGLMKPCPCDLCDTTYSCLRLWCGPLKQETPLYFV